jgi:hypothetical protein
MTSRWICSALTVDDARLSADRRYVTEPAPGVSMNARLAVPYSVEATAVLDV